MSRQPFKRYYADNPGGQFEIGSKECAAQRPKLLALIGHCLITWQNIEAEMALLLGQLLGATNAAAMAVFQKVRQSNRQRETILEAAKAVLTEAAYQELLTAILNVHRSVEKERNDLAHGHWGIYDKMPDGILWMETANYINFKADIVLKKDRHFDDDKGNKFRACLWYYKASDLQAILGDIDDMGWIWSEFIRCLQDPGPPTRAARYRELCQRPRIAQELEKLREK
jgi:hypothetical protein